jgi:histidinol dehydrogenase
MGPAPEALAPGVRAAGCVFVGAAGATAFGDYAAGSNHVLPTGGAARFSGPLGVDAFRRRMSVVEVSTEAAANLAEATDEIAKAEGLPVHGESARAHATKKDGDLQVT